MGQELLDQGDGLRGFLVADQAAGQGMARFQHEGKPRRVGELREDSGQDIARFGVLAKLGQGHGLPHGGEIGRFETGPGGGGGKPIGGGLILADGKQGFSPPHDDFAGIAMVDVLLQDNHRRSCRRPPTA